MDFRQPAILPCEDAGQARRSLHSQIERTYAILRLVTTTALVCVSATFAGAQELSYADVSLSYDKLTADADELTELNLSGSVEGTFGQFYIGADLSSSSFDEGGADNLTLVNFSLSAGYFIVPDALIGVSVTGISLSDGSDTESINGFDVFAQYDTGQFGVAASYARPDSDFEDFSITRLAAEADVMSGVTVGGIVET
ncbi:hypothetical protein [Yoonia sp.]|uniref:hypothetical protein n=1 Tax=Yoonia sp. TaxID=2212373 RepID=UPI002FD8C921